MMFKQARKLGAAVLTAALLVTAGILPSKQAVSAAASVSQSYSTALSETTLTGVFGANDFYFTVDRHWNVQSVNLHLDLSQSQRIDPDGLSELTVSLNGQPVYSAPLRDYLADHSQMDISLDTKKLAAGSNDVKVQVYRRLSDQPCADDVSSANWVRINSGSAVQVQYADQAPALKLSEYPYPFYRLQQAPALPTAVTVGEKADAQELAGALEIASAFGRYAGSNDVTLQTVPLQSLSSPQDDNIIYFGKSGGAPAAIKALFPSGTDFSSGAWMRVAPSPYDAGHVVLAVLADKDTDLERASQFLQNDSLVAQADTDLFHLDSSVNVLTKDTAQGSSYTFSSLGYGGSYLYGVFRKTATMDLKLPQNRELDDSSTVTLHFRYSQNLDFTRSLVTLYVLSLIHI